MQKQWSQIEDIVKGSRVWESYVTCTNHDSFVAQFPISNMRIEIIRLFRENYISIPFPKSNIHIIDKKK